MSEHPGSGHLVLANEAGAPTSAPAAASTGTTEATLMTTQNDRVRE